jgi:hypothetical protein
MPEPPDNGGRHDVNLIGETPSVSTKPDKPTEAELEVDEKGIRNALLRQLLRHRETYAFGIFLLVILWLIGIFFILLWQGLSWRHFHLDNSVLLAAIGSTTANIIGVLLIIVKFIFTDETPKNPKTRQK